MNRKRIGLVVQALVTAALLVNVFREFDWRALGAALGRMPWWFYPASLVAFALGQLVWVGKWAVVLRALEVPVSLRELSAQYLMSVFFNNFLPSSVGGDVSRTYYLGRERGYVAVGTSVFLDRLLGLIGLAGGGAALLFVLHMNAPVFQATRSALAASAAVLLGGLTMVVLLPVRWTARALSRIPRVARAATSFHDRLGVLRARPYLVFQVVLIVLAYDTALAAIYAAFFRVAASPAVPFWPLVACLAAIGALSSLPIAVNGLGLREQLHATLLGSLAVPKEIAVGVSLLIFAHLIVLSLAGAGLWLRRRSAAPAPAAAFDPVAPGG